MWNMHTMELYSAVKRSGGLIHAPTQMHVENAMLSEKSQKPETEHNVQFHGGGKGGGNGV